MGRPITNVLFIDHPESDYGAAYLFDGLCSLLGGTHVCTFPRKYSYYGRPHSYALPEIPNGFTGPLAWQQVYPALNLDIPDDAYEAWIVERLQKEEFDVVIVASPRRVALETYARLKDLIQRTHVPVILHDGEDYPEIQWSIVRDVAPRVLLKREMAKDTPRGDQNGLLTLSYPFSTTKNAVLSLTQSVQRRDWDQAWDATAIFGRTCDYRQTIADAIRCDDTIPAKYVSIQPDYPTRPIPENSTGTHLSWAEYIVCLMNSKCAVSTRGHGLDTCRAWEIPLATAMVRDVLNLQIDNDFTHMENALLYSSPEECLRCIHTLRENQSLRMHIFSNGVAHTLQYHTTEARVRTLLDRVTNL